MIPTLHTTIWFISEPDFFYIFASDFFSEPVPSLIFFKLINGSADLKTKKNQFNNTSMLIPPYFL